MAPQADTRHANIRKPGWKPTWTCGFWLSAAQRLLGGIGVALLMFVLLSTPGQSRYSGSPLT
jgi:hypothetical protein